jgi:pyruvate dehydrogenase E1 component alpha subunit
MDVMKVYEAAEDAHERVRKEGPYFLEVLTYRYEGHSMGDPERYRSKEEVGEWEENDPIGIFRTFLLDNDHADEDELNKIEAEVIDEIQEAVEFAEESPDPSWEDLINTVYVEEYRDETWPR